MKESLSYWQAQRNRIASALRHGSIDAETGRELVAMCDERIAEHAHGIVPHAEAEAEQEQPAPAAPVIPLRSARQDRDSVAGARMRAVRNAALAKYRADMRARTGRDPLESTSLACALAMRNGQPMMVSPALWMLDLPEQP
jgi:hypothetical protein